MKTTSALCWRRILPVVLLFLTFVATSFALHPRRSQASVSGGSSIIARKTSRNKANSKRDVPPKKWPANYCIQIILPNHPARDWTVAAAAALMLITRPGLFLKGSAGALLLSVSTFGTLIYKSYQLVGAEMNHPKKGLEDFIDKHPKHTTVQRDHWGRATRICRTKWPRRTTVAIQRYPFRGSSELLRRWLPGGTAIHHFDVEVVTFFFHKSNQYFSLEANPE